MKEFKGCVIPDGFDENINLIKNMVEENLICADVSDFDNFACLDCEVCLLSICHRPILREYLATLETQKPFAVGSIIAFDKPLEIMSSFNDGDELYYAVKRYYDGKCDGLYIISSKKLIHDMNQCKVELIAQNKLHKQTIEENQVKIDAIEKLLGGEK